MFTIPSLALFVLLGPITGFLSRTTAIIGLTLYTLLILLRNTVEGLNGVPGEVREAAIAMGYKPAGLLWRVQVPLALPVIMAGLRIATVTTIGLVTVTALIGQGGLGQLFLDGFNRAFPTPLLVGLGLSVLFAVVADVVLLGVQRSLTPWSARPRHLAIEEQPWTSSPMCSGGSPTPGTGPVRTACRSGCSSTSGTRSSRR